MGSIFRFSIFIYLLSAGLYGHSDVGTGIVYTSPAAHLTPLPPTRLANAQEREQLLRSLKIYFDLCEHSDSIVDMERALKRVQKQLRHLVANRAFEMLDLFTIEDSGELSRALAGYRQTAVAELTNFQRLAAATRVLQLILGGPMDQQQPYVAPAPVMEIRTSKTSGLLH